MRLKDKPPCASFAAHCPVQAVQICRIFERFRGHRHGSGRITGHPEITTGSTVERGLRLGVRITADVGQCPGILSGPQCRDTGTLRRFRDRSVFRGDNPCWMSGLGCTHPLTWHSQGDHPYAIRFHRPKAALRLLKTVSVPRGRRQRALDSPIALASKFAAHSYRSATDGSTLIAFRAGK
jgi:hypothetical protein